MRSTDVVRLIGFCGLGLFVWSPRSRAEEVKPLQIKMHRVASVAISPDGKTLAAGGEAPSRVEEGLADGIIRLWDLATGREKGTLWQSGDGANSVRSLVFSRDGKLLVGGDNLGYSVWELSTGKEHLRLEDGFSYTGAAFSPDGKTLAIPTNSYTNEPKLGAVRLVEVSTGRETDLLPPGDPGPILSVAFSPDGKLLATAGHNCDVTIWDLSTKKVLFKDDVHWVLNCCTFSPDGVHLVSAGEGGAVKLYRVTTREGKVTVEKQEDSPRYRDSTDSILFSPDGLQLLVAGYNEIRVWEFAGWRPKTTLKGTRMAISGDGKMIAVSDLRRGSVEVGAWKRE